MLRLNVGGSFYTTTRPTFLHHPNSLLARIATGHHHVPRDDRNFLVIDRDGNVFRSVTQAGSVRKAECQSGRQRVSQEGREAVR